MAKKFPLLSQHDSKDCGPTCLQMVHRFYGGDIPISLMRDLCDLNIDGVTIAGMAVAAEHLGMDAMATRVAPNTLSTLPVPFIAHWVQEHFVVVTAVRKGRVTVADPEQGMMTYSEAEFIRHWLGARIYGEVQATPEDLKKHGAVLFLSPTPALEAQSKALAAQPLEKVWRPLKNLPEILRANKAAVIAIGLIFPVVMAITVVLPLLMQRVIDQGIAAQNVSMLGLLLGGYLVLLLSRNVIAALRDLALLYIGTQISIEIVHGFMSQLLKLRMSFFERRSLGDLIQRQQDHRRIEEFLTTQSLPVFFSLLTFSVFAVMLATYDLMLLVVIAVSATLTLLWIAKFYRHRRRFDLQQFELEGAVQAQTIEIMSAVPDLKSFGITKQKSTFYRSLLQRRYDTTLRALRLDEIQNIGAILLMDIGEIIALYLAGRMVISQEGSLGDFVAVMYILGQLRGPLARMVPFFQAAQDAHLSLGRLQSLGEEPIEPETGTHDAEFHKMPACDIHLNDVGFRYSPLHSEDVLHGLNFTIGAGKVTAIVGASGSGKSTLIKLLTRFHEASAGQITYGDLPLATTSAQAWRSRIGLVLQEGMIFDTTLRYNVTLSHGAPDMARLEQALKTANVSDFLDDLPMDVMTSIGRAGWQLSTGQKQRVMIARALYRSPEILIFDEATSALDSNNEAEITASLAQAFRNRTSIVIAHRLSTIRNADHIVVLEKGRVVEQGTHDALVARDGLYRHIFARQLN